MPHHLHDNCEELEDVHNPSVDCNRICMVEALFHKAMEAGEQFCHSDSLSLRRLPLDSCCMVLCDKVRDKYGYRTSEIVRKDEYKYVLPRNLHPEIEE